MVNVEILKQKGHNFLWIDGYLTMWDIPVEQRTQQEIANQVRGDVLVAGYGLGIVQQYLSQNDNVKSLLTIELLPEVIEECKREYGKIYGGIAIGDFRDYQTGKRFDWVIGDIWEDILVGCLGNYEKFKNKSMELIKPDGKIFAWGQDFFEYMLDKQQGGEK